MTDWWQPTFQTTIDAFYQGDLDAGRDACERLLSVEGLPDEIERQTRRNLVFYASNVDELAPSLETRPIEIPVPKGWSRFNPSVAAGPDGLGLIVRSSNYTMTKQLQYTIEDESNVIRTTNYLASLTPDLEIGRVVAIDDRAFREEPPPFPVAGFEDCRLFAHCGSWWVSATVRDRDARGICQMTALRLREDGVAQELHVLSDGSGRHEKNWMPVQAGDGEPLRFVYSCYPTVVLTFDDASGTVAPEIIQPGPLVARHFSGGSQAIPIDGGHLALVHEAVNFEDWTRVYTHRWVWFDEQWRLARLSPPFILDDRQIEFAAGLARHGDDLLLSYGIWDREAWLATVALDEIMPLLAPPLDPDRAEAELRLEGATVHPVTSDLGAPAQTAPAPAVAEEPMTTRGQMIEGFTPVLLGSPSIVSMTLAGNSREIIGDALRSVVDWVDSCLVIDTGISDDTLEIAREIAGDKLIVRQFPWQDDFSAARNFALAAAAETGAEWAVTLDTDERLDPGNLDVRAELAKTQVDALHIQFVGGSYGKERFFRLPARGLYVGPTHEAFVQRGGNGTDTLAGMLFDELGKTPEQYRHKAERDAKILLRHTKHHPDDPRWFYYLGDTLAGLGMHEEAVGAFLKCAGLNGWDEEGAWAMYRAAESLLKIDRPAEAIEACATGMAKHAGLAELSWLAAYASWQANRAAQAVYWARHAIALGHFAGSGAEVPRIGFRYPPALYEGPYDVLRFALRRLGDDAGADEAERLMEEAQAARERNHRFQP
jgi:tetratricopeptide (TPR) repeat protein